MKLVIEFDYGWFWFSVVDYLFPVTSLDKALKKDGRKIKRYWQLRWWQVSAWIIFPATFLASFADSISIKRRCGI